jgi:hypothetical protein
MKTYEEVEAFFMSAYMEVSGSFHAPGALPAWKESHYPPKKTLVGPNGQYGCMGRREKSVPARNRTLTLSQWVVTILLQEAINFKK